ncbi:MAG TPA: hypothetical protein VM821_03445, partial [Abditibacteriaceae bacterium]|nr:hypothetical protein [Abditibacteriaceae bacterium]
VGGVAWWPGLVAQSVLGLVCFGVACSLVFGATSRVAAVENKSAASPLDRVLDWLLWPFHFIGNVLSACARWVKNISQALARQIDRVNDAVIARGAQADNAVLTGELRRRVRKANWCRQWLMLALVATSVFGLFVVLPLGLDTWAKSRYLGWEAALGLIRWDDWGEGIAMGTLILTGLLLPLCAIGAGQSFDSDRSNGTLVFLFLTPMSDRAIVWGKTVIELVYLLVLFLMTLPWLLLGVLLSLSGGNWSTVAQAFCGVLLAVSSTLFALHLNIAWAIRARKPGEGSVKALLAYIGSQVALSFTAWKAVRFFELSSSPLLLVCCLMLFLVAAHLALAVLCRQFALFSLRKLRYGDIAASGKMAA